MSWILSLKLVFILEDGNLWVENGKSFSVIYIYFHQPWNNSFLLQVCKKRSKFASGASTSTLPLPARTPSRVGTPSKTPNKLYKHAELISLQHIKRIMDINETEGWKLIFLYKFFFSLFDQINDPTNYISDSLYKHLS